MSAALLCRSRASPYFFSFSAWVTRCTSSKDSHGMPGTAVLESGQGNSGCLLRCEVLGHLSETVQIASVYN